MLKASTPTGASRTHAGLDAARRSPGFWAFVDQGIVSIGSFLVTLVLARRLPVAEFGVFGVLVGVLLTANTAHASFIGIPLMVLSGGKGNRDRLPAVALGWTVPSCALFIAVLAVTVVVLGRPGLLPWAALALVGGQVQETLRRSLMGRLQFGRAIGGDAISYLGQAGGVLGLALLGRATIAAAFVVMAATSLLAAALQLWQVRPAVDIRAFSRDTVQPFWRLGRALIVINGIGVLTFQCFPWLLASLQGVAEVGSFQALYTMVGFANPLMLAVGSIVTTRVAHVQEARVDGRRALELGVARRYGLLGGVPLALYGGALLAVPGFALRAFFGSGSAYRFLVPDLRIFVLFAFAQYTYFVLAGVLNARQDTRSLFRAQAISALTVPLAVLPLILFASVRGAVVGAVVSAGVRAGVAARRALRPEGPRT
jgi:O-antigen/teichoic acid export membrane protein